MIIKDAIEQLQDLKCHCSDMARVEDSSNEWMKDIEALDFAITTVKQESKTITKMLEDIAQEMCEGFCKYTAMEPPEGKDEDWLVNDDESPCGMCPLNRL